MKSIDYDKKYLLDEKQGDVRKRKLDKQFNKMMAAKNQSSTPLTPIELINSGNSKID